MAWWIFQNLVITTVLAASVAAACRVWRIGPVARHALWVLVLIKFITPPVLVWPWAAPDPLGLAMATERPVTQVSALEPDGEPAVVMRASDGADALSVVPAAVAATVQPAAATRTVVWPWLMLAWIAGGAGLLFVEGARLRQLARRIRVEAPEAAIVSRVEALARDLGLRRAPEVVVADITSPVVWAMGRPRILWPSRLGDGGTDACIDGILVHELAHIKRRDHLVGWMELAAGVVWWWNPLFWSVRSALREQAELACDAWVISALPNGRRAYAESLLALSGATLLNPSMAAVGIRPTSRRVLERRLVMIMKGRTSLQLPGVGVCCLALVAAATLPAWAGAPQQLPEPQSPTAVPAGVRPAPAPAQSLPQKTVAVPKVLTAKDVGWRPQASPRMPPPPPHVVRTIPRGTYTVHLKGEANLPADGKELIDKYLADHKAIQDEINQKLEARRAVAVKELEALQEKYTKEGKLDEAVAIRDYLRAGGPGPLQNYRYTVTRR